MCDFSQYGGASDEWLAIQETLPATFIDFSTDPHGMKVTINRGREEASAKVMEQLKEHVQTADYTIPTRDGSAIEARSYRPVSKADDEPLPVYLYFHGGGFLFGTLSSEDAACANTAINTGVIVLNVNYRHAPEHTFPIAWHDAQDAFAWLHKNASVLRVDPAKVVVGGVSAGAQLAASLVLEKHLGISAILKDLPELAGSVLIIPPLAAPDTYAEGALKLMKSPEISSYVENEFAPILPMQAVKAFTAFLKIPEGVSLKDPKLNLLTAVSADDAKGMPPVMFGIAGLDPLRDEALLYAKLLAEAGVATQVRLFKGVPHGFRRFGPALKASAQWDKCVEDGIAWALEKPDATGKFDVTVV